jgi:hypothetical protein
MFFSSAPNISNIITTQYHPCHAAISAVVQGARGRGRRGGPGELGRSLVPSGKRDLSASRCAARPHVARAWERGGSLWLGSRTRVLRRVSRGIETNLACPRPPWRGSVLTRATGIGIFTLGRGFARGSKKPTTREKVTTSCDPRVESRLGTPTAAGVQEKHLSPFFFASTKTDFATPRVVRASTPSRRA